MPETRKKSILVCIFMQTKHVSISSIFFTGLWIQFVLSYDEALLFAWRGDRTVRGAGSSDWRSTGSRRHIYPHDGGETHFWASVAYTIYGCLGMECIPHHGWVNFGVMCRYFILKLIRRLTIFNILLFFKYINTLFNIQKHIKTPM